MLMDSQRKRKNDVCRFVPLSIASVVLKEAVRPLSY